MPMVLAESGWSNESKMQNEVWVVSFRGKLSFG